MVPVECILIKLFVKIVKILKIIWKALKYQENKLCVLPCLAQDALGGRNPSGSRRVLIQDREEINMGRRPFIGIKEAVLLKVTWYTDTLAYWYTLDSN